MIPVSAVYPAIKPFRRFQSMVASASSPIRYPYAPGQVSTRRSMSLQIWAIGISFVFCREEHTGLACNQNTLVNGYNNYNASLQRNFIIGARLTQTPLE